MTVFCQRIVDDVDKLRLAVGLQAA